MFFIIVTCQKENDRPENDYVFANDTTFLKTLIKEKPRLIITPSRLTELKEQWSSDDRLGKYIQQVITDADYNISKPLPEYSNDLLNVSNSVFYLVTNLSFAYLWSNEMIYADKAKKILIKVAGFPDWNDEHFLDAAIMGIAVSLGFDWLYHYLNTDERELIIQALIDKCLIPGKEGIDESVYWTQSNNNWNIICNSSLVISSLAIAEWHRSYADYIVPKAIQSLSIALNEFAPDGVWYEGLSYLRSALDYYSFCISSLLTSINYDFGLTSFEGIENAGEFYISSVGKNNLFLCFADILENSYRAISPNLFFLGTLYDDDKIIQNEHQFLEDNRANVFHTIWYKDVIESTTTFNNQFFSGSHQVMIFNENAYGDNSIYLGIKGGVNGSSHGHLDLGNFEFDALGIRWARDLGYDDYGLPGYFDIGDNGLRWDYFRVNSLSHNVPIINNSSQYPSGNASFIRYSIDSQTPYGIIDLSDAYKDYVTMLNRGIMLLDDDRTILVQDECSLQSSSDYYWGMTTDADIEILDSQTALLKRNNKELYITIIKPDNVYFEVISAYQLPPQNPNINVHRLIARKSADDELNFTVIIQLSPHWDGYISDRAVYIPLNQW